MTNGQSASLSWCRAPIWSPWPEYCFLCDICRFLDVGHPLWREDGSVIYLYNCFWDLQKLLLSGPSPTELTTILYGLIRDAPHLEGHVPIFVSPRNRVAQLYLQELCFLFTTSYNSQIYLQWRYSDPPPHMYWLKSKSKLYYDLRSCRTVCLGVRHSSGTCDQFLSFLQLFLDIYRFVDVGHPLWLEVRSVVYSFCWTSPVQPFWDLSPTGLMSIFYCLYFWDSPIMEGQVPVFIPHRIGVAQLHPPALSLSN
jgi:hypothetical protein